MTEPSISTKVLSVVQEPAEPYESFIGRVLAAAVESGELVPASEVVTELSAELSIQKGAFSTVADERNRLKAERDELRAEVELHRTIANGYASSCSIEYRDKLEDEIRDLRAERDRYKKWEASACRQLGEVGVRLMSPPRLPEAIDDACRQLAELRAERDRVQASLDVAQAINREAGAGLKRLDARLQVLLEAIAEHRGIAKEHRPEDRALYARADAVKRGET